MPDPAAPTTGKPSQRIHLSIVIPAYNEAARISNALESIGDYAADRNETIQVIVVDDGSTDGTMEVVERYREAIGDSADDSVEVRLLGNETNRGKAMSVKRGVLEAEGDLVLFTDADMSTPIAELAKLRAAIEAGSDIAIGSRDLPDSVLDPPQSWRRRTLGHAFRSFRRIFLLDDLRDTQCGFKLFKHAVATLAFGEMTETSPAFDCEILAIAQADGCRIAEVPVLWRNNPDSRIRPFRDGLAMLAGIVRIWWRLRRRRNAQRDADVDADRA